MLEPKLYSAGSDLQYELCGHFIEKIKRNIWFRRKERILDVGCGTGRVTAELLLPILPEDAVLVGGDFRKMVDYANEHHLKDRLSYKVIDIEDANLKTEWEGSSFDKVFSFFCEHWIKDHRKSFWNYHYLLKAGGRLYMTLPDYNNIYGQVDREISKMSKWKEYTEIIKRFSHTNEIITDIKTDYGNILEEQNFVVESIELKNAQKVFDNMEEYLNFVKGISLVVPCLPENLIHSFMDDYTKLTIKYGTIKVEKTTNQVIFYYSNLSIQAHKR